tara:strand:+ start:872 stop:1648 length:777 start_codon:yes stop_codon:yes gene_type:complete
MIDKSLYDKKFYDSTHEHTYSAQIILNIIFRYHRPRSIIDVGCGSGSWLSVADKMGVEKLTGIEADWLKPEMLITKKIDLFTYDVSEPLPSISKNDLAISLEVAEHLSESRSEGFINDLCSLADIVLFSAAIPYQGGDNHINEQWQSYWSNLFSKNNYEVRDIIRPIIWNNRKVKSWYRQNCLLFVNKKIQSLIMPPNHKNPIDLVHPKIFINNPDKYQFMQVVNNDYDRLNKQNYRLKILSYALFIILCITILLFIF